MGSVTITDCPENQSNIDGLRLNQKQETAGDETFHILQKEYPENSEEVFSWGEQ